MMLEYVFIAEEVDRLVNQGTEPDRKFVAGKLCFENTNSPTHTYIHVHIHKRQNFRIYI